MKQTFESEPTASAKPLRLLIENFAHLHRVELALGDLTVLVGPQGAGKSLALQWLKAAIDGRHVVDALKTAGHRTEQSDTLIDLMFGSGMAASWRHESTRIMLDRKVIAPDRLHRIGGDAERLFFIPAHRSMLISDGWASPFQKLTADIPAVARLFSHTLFEQFSSVHTGTLFPAKGCLSAQIIDKIDEAIFHGAKVGIEDAPQRSLRLRLIHGALHLPFMTWSAGQREFTPLLLGLYSLLTASEGRRASGVEWVVIEEPEMGLHPQGITAVMLLVLDLLRRGYRVVLSTHSPHVLTMLWMLRHLQACDARWQHLCDAFDLDNAEPMQQLTKSALSKHYRAYLMDFDSKGCVNSLDITDLDPGANDERIAGWGGLTEYSSRFGAAVRAAVNEDAA